MVVINVLIYCGNLNFSDLNNTIFYMSIHFYNAKTALGKLLCNGVGTSFL